VPGPYSAGSVLLEVVPVFRDVQNSIQREAEDIGRAIGKDVGDNVDKEASKAIPNALDKALKNPKVSKSADEAGKSSGARFGGAFRTAVDGAISKAMNDMGRNVDVGIADLAKRLRALKDDVNLSPDLDARKVMAELAMLERQLRASGRNMDLTLDARLDADTLGDDLAEVRRTLEARGIVIDVDADTAGALAELAVLDRDRKVKVKADVDTSQLSIFERLLVRSGMAARGAASGGDAATSSFRGFNGVLATAVSIGPLLIPILAALAGGALALGTSLGVAATGLVPLALGLAGVGTAVGALADVENDAAKDQAAYARTLRTASNGVRDAQLAVTRAREAAGESAEQASRRIRDAMRAEEDAAEGVIRAQRAVTRAEEDHARAQEEAIRAQRQLTRAREEAQDQLRDMQLQLRGGALAERQAVIDLFEAQVAYRNALADPGATSLERERATIAYERQSLALEEIRIRNADLREESERAAAAGVEGSEQVVAAQRGVADANRAVADAQQGIVDANAAVVEAQQRVADAAEATADAQIAAARDQRDSTRAIEDAQRRLADAQLSYNDALFRTGELGSASMQALDEAMAKLSPAGQAFALWIFGLRGELQELRNLAQEGLLPGLQGGLQLLIDTYGPGFRTFVGEISSLLGEMASVAAQALTTPVWQDFFAMIGEYAPIFMRQWGQIALSLSTGIAAIMTAAAPFAQQIGEIWAALFGQFAAWASSPEGAAMITSFLEHVAEITPDVLRFLGALAGALLNLMIAIAPYAEIALRLFTGFLEFIAGLDPKILGAIVLGILVLVGTMQAIFGILAGAGIVIQVLFALVTGAVGSTTALVVGALILLAGAFAFLWANSETFRDIVTGAFRAVRDFVAGVVEWFRDEYLPRLRDYLTLVGERAMWVWENLIKPAFDFIAAGFRLAVEVISWYWENVLSPVFSVIGAVITWLWENIALPLFRRIGEQFQAMGAFISWVWNGVLGPVFELVGAIITWLWENIARPIFGWIGDRFSELGQIIGIVWESTLKPIFDAFGNFIEQHVAPVFQRGIDTIARIWSTLMELSKAPVRFVVEEVINKGIIANFNKLADVFGTSHIDPLQLPASWATTVSPTASAAARQAAGGGVPQFATGGQIGGYSPTPTADNIPIMATAGEFMEPVHAVRTYGADLFEAFRLGLIDPRMARMLLAGGLPGFASGGLIDFGRLLQSMGFRVGEHPAFGGVNPVHMKNSLHYSGRAIDVNWAPGTSAAEQRAIDNIVPLAIERGLGVIWRVKNHFGHAHVEDSNYRAIGAGGTTAPGTGIFARVMGAAKSLFDDPLAFLRAGVDKVTGTLNDTIFGRMLMGGVGKLVDSAIDFVTGQAPGEVAVPEGKTQLYDNGGIVPKGLSGVLNLTGGNEHMGILTDRQWESLHRAADGISGDDVDINVSVRDNATANEVVSGLLFELRHARRGGVYGRRG
jgi:hypothetical protein